MTTEKKPDNQGWYHFDGFDEFHKWVEGLPEFDPKAPPANCQPMRIKHIPVCRGGCPRKEECFTQIEIKGNTIKVRCHCQ